MPDESTPETPPTQPGNLAGWQYSDYLLQKTLGQRRERLLRHINEVSQKIGGFHSRSGGDGWSYSRFALTDYLKNLKVELKDMETGMDRPRKPRFVALR